MTTHSHYLNRLRRGSQTFYPALHWDDFSSTPKKRPQGTLHCRLCAEDKPKGVKWVDFEQIEVGVCKAGGIQIWCRRHKINIALIIPVIMRDE